MVYLGSPIWRQLEMARLTTYKFHIVDRDVA
jgi:hypothetical protein